MKIENLLNKPLWQMTGEEFMFLSKSATSDSAPRQPKVTVDASSHKYVYSLSGIAQLFGCSIPTANRIKKILPFSRGMTHFLRNTAVLKVLPPQR